MSRRHRNRSRERRRYRPESTKPSVVIAMVIVGAITAAVTVVCVWLLVSTIDAGLGPFDSVGVARPTPAWFALIGLALGALAAGKIAWDAGAYLVRVIRKRPKQVLAQD
ncbi:hypothetical protein [Agromyces sp. Marseille-Q5079]|uniref:hypothetical protein n=1 Tax=Agromyces sp. Marseille-Q5079 TaxID=3439059 RepID=UPI003D9C7F3F